MDVAIIKYEAEKHAHLIFYLDARIHRVILAHDI